MAETTPDHDLLIIVNTKLDILISDMKDYKSSVNGRIEELWKVVDKHTEQIQTAKGIGLGMRMVFMAIGALPPSIVAILIGVLNNA